MKRTEDMQQLSHSDVGRSGMFFALFVKVLVVSVFAGIIGGIIAMAFSGTAVNLQLTTIILKVGPSAIPKGVILAIILGILGNILPMLKLCFFTRSYA